MSKPIYLLTGNERKKHAFQKAIEGYDILIESKKIWLPEIQSENTDEVANFASQYGANQIEAPAIKVDVGLFIDALGGFPGPFVHYVHEQIGADIFFEMIRGLDNRAAHIKTSVSYCEPGKHPICFSSITQGYLVDNLQKGEGSLLDRLFVPLHEKNPEHLTLGAIRELDYDRMLEMWGDAEEKFAKWYLSHQGE